MKELIRTLQLAVSAEEHNALEEIDEAWLPEIEQARKRLTQMRGSDVVAALVAMRRAGLSLNRDLRPRYASISEPAPKRPARNRL